jgi:hypothetical protein
MQLAFKNYATLIVACWLNKDYYDGILSFIANVKPDQAEMIDFLEDFLLNLSPELNKPYDELLNLAINDVDFSELADAFLKEFCNV